MSNKNGFRFFYALSLATQLGFLIAASLGGFILLGVWLDRTLGTEVVFVLAGSVIGIVLTVVEVYHIILPLIRKHHDEHDSLA